MNKLMSSIGTNISRVGSKLIFKCKKASPELLIGGGIAAILTGVVIACVKTKEAEAAINTSDRKIEEIHNEADANHISADEEKKYVRQEKIKMVGGVVKAYSIPAALVIGGISMILVSHGIMKKREAALLTAYNALDAMFKQYRDRIRAEDGGLERDRRALLGDDYPSDDVMNQNEIDDINREGLKLMHVNSPYGPYTFEFSRYSTKKWSADPWSNLNTIRSAEDWANRQLRLCGHLFLNDILKYLDMDEVPWGQLCGWIRGAEDGDNYVQILATEDRASIEMDDDCWKKPIFLEFNCDGAIWDKI